MGRQGALETFQFEAQGRKMNGYLLAFTRDNVMVFMLEVGLPGVVTEKMILFHAQLVDQRLH